jgi:hypothetical protein
MNTYPTGVPETTPRAKSKGDRPVNAIERSTIRAIEEAVTVGCGLNLRHAMTAEAGHEFEDWLAAEAEIQSLWTRAFEEAPLHCGN